MALSKKVIKQKIATARNIRKTTKTMEMISAVKMRRMIARTNGVRQYAHFALELIKKISQVEELSSPLIAERKHGRTLLVIIASQKGLCGGYNVNLGRKLLDLLKTGKLKAEETDVIAVGRNAEKMALRAKFNLVASFPGLSEIASPAEVMPIFNTFMDKFLETNHYQRVVSLHTGFIKPMEYEPLFLRVLPLSKKMLEGITTDTPVTKDTDSMNIDVYTFEPSRQAILSQALPQLLQAVFFEDVIESLAAEHGSRMVAMKSATDNAEAMQTELTLWFNKARQQAITQEISEISGGAEALAGATLSV